MTAISDGRIEGLLHTQRATAKLLRESRDGYDPSWSDHMEAVADELERKSLDLLVACEVLKFYRDEFKPKIGKPIPGASSITFHPSEALLDDCGNRAMTALSSLPQEQK